MMKYGSELAKKRVPLSSRKAVRTYAEKSQQSGTNDWKVEIAMPKSRNISVGENPNDESEGSSLIKRCERTNSDIKSINNIGYEYVELDDKQECSSVSNLFTECIKSEVVTTHSNASDDTNLVKSTGTSQRFAVDEVSTEEQRYLAKVHDRRSLDSTITDSTSHTMHGCCSQTEKDMMSIRKHLLEIENKQASLVDMLQVTAFVFLAYFLHMIIHCSKSFRSQDQYLDLKRLHCLLVFTVAGNILSKVHNSITIEKIPIKFRTPCNI